MAKNLAGYLGTNAVDNGDLITISLAELYKAIFPESTEPYSYNGNPDKAVAILIAGIHALNKPVFNSEGLDVTPNTQALVSQESFQERTFEVRDDVSQIKHEFVFSIYTEDNTGFNPVKAV